MILQAIEHYANTHPNRAALYSNGHHWTYADLQRRILQAQALLCTLSLESGSRIGLAIGQLELAWLLILACERMGLSCIPLPGSASPNQLSLSDIGAWITDGEMDTSSLTRPMRVTLDEIERTPFDLVPPITIATADTECFILCSSGTTGSYKKLALTRSIRDIRAQRHYEAYGYPRDCRHFAGNLGPWTSHGYTATGAILTHGGLIIYDQSTDIYKILETLRPTSTFLTPGIAQNWLAELAGRSLDLAPFRINFSGGTLTEGLWLALVKAFPYASIKHNYASTETAAIAETMIRSAGDLDDHRLRTDIQIEIVNEHDQPIPAGEVGAIRVRSPSMLSGYLNDAEANRQFFRDGWFYPGDMGAIHADGRLRLSGRFSEVINYQGNKISPVVIEDRLKQHAKDMDCAVIGIPDPPRADILCILVQDKTAPDKETLIRLLNPLRNAFSQIIVRTVPKIHRTTTGKTRYIEMRKMYLADIASERSKSPARPQQIH